MKLSIKFIFLCICALSKIVCSTSDMLSQLPAAAESFTDMLIAPVKEIKSSLSPASTANFTRAIINPELKIFRETALGIKSFLSDLKDVAAAVDNSLQDPLKDDKSNLLSFRDSLDKAYKKTEDLYEKFESNFNGTRSDRITQDKTKYGASLAASRQNIGLMISQIEDEVVKNIRDSLIPQGAKKYSVASMDNNADIERIRDVLNDINHNEDNKGSFSPDNGLFKTMKEWSDVLKSFRQNKSLSTFTEPKNSIKRTESLKNIFGIPLSTVDSNNGLSSLMNGDVLGSTSSLLENLASPLTKIYNNSSLYHIPASSSLGGRISRMLIEDNDEQNFFRLKNTTNVLSRSASKLDNVLPTKPSLSNIIKTGNN